MSDANVQDFDVGNDEAEGSVALKNVIGLASQLHDVEEQIENVEDTLSMLNERARFLKQVQIPQAMAELGQTEFTMEDGTKIKIEDYVSGTLNSLPSPEAYDRAIKLLEEYEAGDLIKTDINVSFGREEYEEAKRIFDLLSSEGMPVDIKTGVHPKTLQSFARECLRNGTSIDLDALGLKAGRYAKITLPKKQGRK